MNVVPIVFAANTNYIPYLSTALQSIIENSNTSNYYHIYILELEIDEEYKKLLREQIDQVKNFELEFVDVSSIVANFNPYVGKLSKETYFRLLIPYVIPTVDKLIYVDCDIIVARDLHELFTIDLNGEICGAALGLAEIRAAKMNAKHHMHELGLKSIDRYFNAGIMLFDTLKFRNYISLDDVLRFAESRVWGTYDQDVLNVLFEDQVYYISNKWNFIRVDYILKEDNDTISSLYFEASENPSVIHFAANAKPWNVHYLVPNAIEFWMFAMRTPFKKEMLKRMDAHTIYTYKNKNYDELPLSVLVKEIFRRIKRKLRFINNAK